MDNKVNYAVVGFFVILLGSAAIIFFFWLATFHREKTYDTYLTYFKEDVTGLAVQSPVRYNGVPVGYVKSIDLDPRNPQRVQLNLQIEVGSPITTGTVATLQMQGITGVLYVGLKVKASGAPPLEAIKGQKYPVIPSEPSILKQLSQVIPDLSNSLKKVSDSIARLLNDENQKNIRISLHNIAVGTKDLPQLVKSLNSASGQIGNAAKTGQGALRNFSNQLIPSTQQLLDQLTRTTSGIQQLTNELQRNPSMLIRGRKPVAPGPGERK